MKKVKKTRQSRPFVHLHGHDEYSKLDGVGTVEQYIQKAIDLGLPAFTITNHGSVGQWVRQYFGTKNEDGTPKIKNIFGVEPYLMRDRDKHLQRIKQIDIDLKAAKGKPDEIARLREERKKIAKYNHIILLAKNEIGKTNILRILNESVRNGFYSRARIDWDILLRYHNGLIVTSACMGGEIAQAILNDDPHQALRLARVYQSIWEEDFYLELQLHDTPGQDKINEGLLKLGKKLGIECIITNDSHYLNEEDSLAQDTMLLIKNKKTWADVEAAKNKKKEESDDGSDDIWLFDTKQLWYKSENELYKEFVRNHMHYMTEEQYDRAIDNTVIIANKCEDIKWNTNAEIPYFCDPNDIDNIFRQELNAGWKKRKLGGKVYFDRAKYEQSVVNTLGYQHYFLIMKDIINWAKGKYGDESVGPARGSGGGSLLNYTMGITNIDPMPNNLVFERFLNPERKDIPDIDTDFMPEIRDEVKDYIQQKFGVDKTASIATYGTYQTRGILGDIARAFGIPSGEMRAITSKIESDADEMTWSEIYELYPELADMKERYPEAFRVAETLRGQIRNLSKHAAGVVITRGNINKEIALTQRDGFIISEWVEGASRSELGKIGKVKFDILGLTTLSELKEANDLVEKKTGKRIDWDKIDEYDQKALKLCQKADTDTIFQFGSFQMKQLLKNSAITCIDDLGAISAVGRPGPLRGGVASSFCKRSRGKEDIEYPEILKSVLGPTYGLIIYQEQLMQIPQLLAGFTMAEADKMRKLLTKIKKETEHIYAEERTHYRQKFIDHAKDKLPVKELEHIWALMEEFAKYGFNHAHAYAYAVVSYRAAYMMAHHQLEWFIGVLNSKDKKFKEDQESPIAKVINVIRAHKIDVLPPIIGKSQGNFKPEENSIRFGLSYIKNVGIGPGIALSRQQFKAIGEFIDAKFGKDVNSAALKALALVGAFDNFYPNRKSLVESIALWKKPEEAKEFLKTNLKTMKDYSEAEKLLFQKEYLGLYLTSHPVEQYLDQFEKNKVFTIAEMKEKNRGKVAGVISAMRRIINKKGKPMAFLTIEDHEFNKLDITVWEEYLNDYEEELQIGKVVAIKATQNDRGFSIGIKDNKRQVILLENLA